ncbi:MAG: hypothetical protein GX640_10330, partial [Fibrobacter sp.]|nr:hypothetical protein [Fibrobacter sp.]
MIPHALSGLEFVERFYTFPSRNSTNAFARTLQKTPGFNKLIVVQADNHPYGFSEETEAVSGSLTASIIADASNKTLFFHTRAMFLAIIISIEKIIPHPIPLQILWPDRIYWSDKEICQIKTEKSHINPDFIVLGFSLLVNTANNLLFHNSHQETTSLQIQTSRQHSASRLLYNIIVSYYD